MMFSKVTRRFGVGRTLGVLALVVALVAVSVPAVADPIANSALSLAGVNKKANKANKTAKQALKLAKSKAEQGPQGPAGAKGDAGAQGAAGANGTDGANGTSVTTAAENPGANCPNGGARFQGTGGPTYACDGQDGETGFTSTLPSGETEKGAWAVGQSAGPGLMLAPISFAIPLQGGVTAPNTHVIGVGGTPPAACNDGSGTAPSADNPEADPGHLCVFAGVLSDANFASVAFPGSGIEDVSPPSGGFTNAGSGATGAVINIAASGAGGVANGTFAVTAP